MRYIYRGELQRTVSVIERSDGLIVVMGTDAGGVWNATYRAGSEEQATAEARTFITSGLRPHNAKSREAAPKERFEQVDRL